MGMGNDLKEPCPNVKLHIIAGGVHGFRKNQDVVAVAHLRGFAE